MNTIRARDPRAEAQALLPDGYEARVLEPSPPANTDPDWYADDPTDPEGAAGKVVTPIAADGTTWDEVFGDNPDAASFLSDRWLGSFRRLQPIPEGYRTTREGLHQVAFFAIAPKRYEANGKMGLRYTHQGFGTPFFGDDEQVRVEGDLLVYQKGGDVTSTPLTTVGEACDHLDIPYREVWFEDFHDPLTPVGGEEGLQIDPKAALAIGDWFGFATLVLESARRTPGAEDVTRVQLWPEHFDPAFEMGSHEKGHRASFGASPGDEANPEPYLYVAAWEEIDRSDPFWNDASFNGASLSYQELLDSKNQIETAVDFLKQGHETLTGH